MKIIFVFIFFLVSAQEARSQWIGVPRDVELTLSRIERAFYESDPISIQDLFQPGIMMRLEDSLYHSIPGTYALRELEKFFSEKDSVDFRFGFPGSGTMYYTKNGKRESIEVDVWLRRDFGEIFIYALNISNYPTATVFFNIYGQK